MPETSGQGNTWVCCRFSPFRPVSLPSLSTLLFTRDQLRSHLPWSLHLFLKNLKLSKSCHNPPDSPFELLIRKKWDQVPRLGKNKNGLEKRKLFPCVCGQDSPLSLVPAFRGGRPWPQAALGCLYRMSLSHSVFSLNAPEPEGGLGIPSAFFLAGPRPHFALLNFHLLLRWAQLSLLWPNLDMEWWGLFLLFVSKPPSLL